MLFKCGIIVDAFLFAPLFQFFAVNFFRLCIHLFLLFGSSDFRFHPNLAPRFAFSLLAGANDHKFFIDRLFDRYGNEHEGIHQPCNRFQPHKEERKNRIHRFRLIEDDSKSTVRIGDNLLHRIG